MRLLTLLTLTFLSSSVHAQALEWSQKLSKMPRPNRYLDQWDVTGASSVATDKAGNLYVSGLFNSTLLISGGAYQASGDNVYVAKLGPAGNVLWVHMGPTSNLVGPTVAVDSIGNVYLLRAYFGTSATLGGVTIDQGSVKRVSSSIWKINSAGAVEWGKTMATLKDTTGYAPQRDVHLATLPNCKMQVDRFGNIYYYLLYEDSVKLFDTNLFYSKSRNAVLTKLDGGGDLIWRREIKQVDTFSIRPAIVIFPPHAALAVTRSGHCYISLASYDHFRYAESTMSNPLDSAHMIVKIDPTGKYLWKRALGKGFRNTYDWELDNYDTRVALSCSANEDLYLLAGRAGGDFKLSGERMGILGVAKVDSAGKSLWVRRIGRKDSAGKDWDFTSATSWHTLISTNALGDCAVAFIGGDLAFIGGDTIRRAIIGKRFRYATGILQFDSNGKLYWGDMLEGNNYNFGTGLAINSRREVYLNGYFLSSLMGREALIAGDTNYYFGFLFKYGNVELSTPSPAAPKYCEGDSIIVDVTATMRFHPGNIFKAYLSDTGGTFNKNIRLIGSITSSDSVTTIRAKLPDSARAGAKYRIRVSTSHPEYIASDPGPEFEILSAPPVAIRSKSTKLCEGSNLDLTGIGANTYRWSTGDTIETINISKPGKYIVTGYNEIGCQKDDTIDVELVALPVASLNITGDTTFCDGGQTRLSAFGGKTYRWSNGEVTQEITVRRSGLYSVTVTNEGGCTDESRSVKITVLPSPPKPTITRDGNVLTSSAEYHNRWYINGTKLEGDTSNTLIATKTGRYSVRVTNDEGCTSPATDIDVIIGSSTVAHPKISSGIKVCYSPAPIIDYECEYSSLVGIELIDILGSRVAELHNGMISGPMRFTIPPGIVTGVYHIRVSREGNIETIKIAIP